MRSNHTRENPAEAKFRDLAEENGWFATKRGWPDFLVETDDGELIAVEVKPRIPSGRMKVLKREQVRTMQWLSSLGVRCFLSDGETLEPFDQIAPRDKSRR